MESEASLNLADLDNLFFGQDSEAQKGYIQARRAAPEELIGLNSSRLEVVDEDFLQLREALDRFLDYCGLLEIACEIGYVAEEDVRTRYWSYLPGAHNFSAVLEIPQVGDYWRPRFRLVNSFTDRFVRGYYLHDDDLRKVEGNIFPFFQRFLAIVLDLRNNVAARAFFAHLDLDGPDDLLLEKASDPSSFLPVLVKPENELSKIEFEALGLHNVLASFARVDSLLRDCTSFGFFRRQVLAFYSPYRRFRTALAEAVDRLLSWTVPETESSQPAVVGELTKLQRAMWTVFSERSDERAGERGAVGTASA